MLHVLFMIPLLSLFKNNLSNILILVAFIFIAIFVSGCVENNDDTAEFETLPQVQQFMEDYPDRDINIKYYLESKIAEEQSQEWGGT